MFLKPEIIILSLYFFWLVALSFVFIQFYGYYRRLLKNSRQQSFIKILDELINHNIEQKQTLKDLHRELNNLKLESTFHIQKIGLLRFNPFKDTGGDQSFILAVVDAHNTGVVISGLHTRSGTRWYAKKVVNGKGVEYNLSEDEEKALKEAKKLNKS